MNIERLKNRLNAVIEASNEAHDASVRTATAYASLATAMAEFQAELQAVAATLGGQSEPETTVSRRH